MNTQKIPEDMQDVRDRVDLMAGRGFTVSEEDVIKEALKKAFNQLWMRKWMVIIIPSVGMKPFMTCKSLGLIMSWLVQQNQKRMVLILSSNLKLMQRIHGLF